MLLDVTDIQQGCTHDGPGLRTTVFLKGCPLHCRWCHNPETQSCKKEFYYRPEKCISCLRCVSVCPQKGHLAVSGVHEFDPTNCIFCMACAEGCPSGALEPVSQQLPLRKIMEYVLADRVFYRNRGGLTVSGGEPTLQWEGLLALLDAARAEGIGTCLETCGMFPSAGIPELVSRVDLFLYDIKDTDPKRLKEHTGGDLEHIVNNLLLLDRAGASTALRCILIPEVNLDPEHGQRLAQLYGKLSHCQYIELLPYHPYGLSKAQQLGRSDPQFSIPERPQLEAFARILTEKAVPVKLYGSMLAEI